jgi:hypothetical protein
MIRNLKVFMLAAFALLAFGALASSAQAVTSISKPAEAITLTVTPDGSTTTSHQVFDAGANGAQSITCNSVTGESTIAGTATSFTTALATNIVYSTCSFIGQPAEVKMNGCKYDLGINASNEGNVAISGCNAGQKIEFFLKEGDCKVTVGEQSGKTRITYHNPNANEVTVEPHVTGIVFSAAGADCLQTGTNLTTGNYTTGNFLLTAEKDGTSTMVAIQANNPEATVLK